MSAKEMNRAVLSECMVRVAAAGWRKKEELMGEMIELVARAIAGSFTQPDEFWENWIPQARAAIEAMREPSFRMLHAAAREHLKRHGEGVGEVDAALCWQAMISAAVSTNENTAS